MTNVIDLRSSHPLIGDWKSCDGFSDVVYRIASSAGTLQVTGEDIDDGEKAKIYDVVVNEDLSIEFAAYWPSTGRFVKYRFRVGPNGRAMVTYTYTDKELWERI